MKESFIKPSADEIEALFAAADTEADRLEAEEVKAALDQLFVWHQRVKNDDLAQAWVRSPIVWRNSMARRKPAAVGPI